MGNDEGSQPNYLMGALVGGAIMGALSAFPICLNACCFIWGFVGGLVGAWMASRPARVFGPREGIIAGAAAFGAGIPIYLVIAAPISMLMGKLQEGMPRQPVPPGVPPALQGFMEQLNRPGSIVQILTVAAMVYGFWLFMAPLGGIVGGLLFKKPKDGGSPLEDEAEY